MYIWGRKAMFCLVTEHCGASRGSQLPTEQHILFEPLQIARSKIWAWVINLCLHFSSATKLHTKLSQAMPDTQAHKPIHQDCEWVQFITSANKTHIHVHGPYYWQKQKHFVATWIQLLFCSSILRIRSNLSFSSLPLMMLLLQPFVFLNPIRLDCLTIVNKSCHSATISWLPRGKGKCGVPSKANKKQHCTWKWRQLLFTTAITFNYNRLQKKVVGLQRSPIAGSTIIYSSYNYQKSKTKQTKNLAFNRREKKTACQRWSL